MWFIRFRETAWGFFCCCIVFRQRRMLLRIILNFSTRRKKISNYCPLLRFTLYSFLFHLTVSRDVRRTVQSLVSYLVSSNAVSHSKSKVPNRIFTSNEMINPFLPIFVQTPPVRIDLHPPSFPHPAEGLKST